MRLTILKIFFLLLFLWLIVMILPPRIEKIEHKIEKSFVAVITAYTPSTNETDDTPFINAANKRVAKGDIANNCLPFGTRVRIDGNIFTVRDRLNARYGCLHFDILTFDKTKALEWGKQKKVVEVLAKI